MPSEHQHLPTSDAVRGQRGAPRWSWQLRMCFWLFIGIAAFYLFAEHRAHMVLGLYWLPYLLLLSCPLIHLFGHGGHGGHGRQDETRSGPRRAAPPDTDVASSGHSATHEGDRS